jgi:DNA-binding transcriptional LysR family regulator
LKPEWCLGIVLAPPGGPRPWIFRRDTEECSLRPEGRFFFNTTDVLIRTAIAGAGIIYVLEILAREYIERGQLTRILADWETPDRTFYVVYPKARTVPPKVRAFTDFIASVLTNPPGESRLPIRIAGAGKR